ncbi:hypothetical protein L2E82_01856 [Cichorium intybus]|uniref:Uncharacterized protein n=1 Tax=Cichorium intybus TaxID=13427 RepID=A0ACB9GZP3_CICIN|nr:hypothetical protein L2E82_01856 [Cichorium intybus]
MRSAEMEHLWRSTEMEMGSMDGDGNGAALKTVLVVGALASSWKHQEKERAMVQGACFFRSGKQPLSNAWTMRIGGYLCLWPLEFQSNQKVSDQ